MNLLQTAITQKHLDLIQLGCNVLRQWKVQDVFYRKVYSHPIVLFKFSKQKETYWHLKKKKKAAVFCIKKRFSSQELAKCPHKHKVKTVRYSYVSVDIWLPHTVHTVTSPTTQTHRAFSYY